MKKLLMVLALSVLVFGQQPTTGRFWGYANATALLGKNWAYVVMPGVRYEFARSDDTGGTARKLYFTELLTGPVYTVRNACVALKIPVWYYYIGFVLF